MARSDSTCWILVQGAAAGNEEARDDFARRYVSVVRAYLGARWRGSPWLSELEDAVQEVFVDCFRTDGLLQRVDAERPGGFRAFLYGAVRLVALRFEREGARQRRCQRLNEDNLNQLEGDDVSLSRAFDRAWAEALLREARRLQRSRAVEAGDGALRRIELLRLRFTEDLPIRDIARRWETDAAVIHKEYARARREFKESLLEVIAFHYSGMATELERRCTELLELVNPG